MINNEESNRKFREKMEERKKGRIKAVFPKLFVHFHKQVFKKSVIYLSIAFLFLLYPYKRRKEGSQGEKAVPDSI